MATWKLLALVLAVSAGSWLLLVAPASSTHSADVKQLAALQRPQSAPIIVKGDASTARAGVLAFSRVSAKQLRAYVDASAQATGVHISKYQASTSGASTSISASVSASGTVSTDVAFLAALTKTVTFTPSGTLNATGPLYVLSSVSIGASTASATSPTSTTSTTASPMPAGKTGVTFIITSP